MRSLVWVGLGCVLALSSCVGRSPATIAIVDGAQLRMLVTQERAPVALLAQSGILLAPADQVLFNGQVVARDVPLPGAGSGTLQIRRAVSVSINGKSVATSARTVGEALAAAGLHPYVSDSIDPAASSPVTRPVTVSYVPSQELTVKTDGRELRIRTGASTVGRALAEAGLPLVGLDYSKPAESEALPADGSVRIVRVYESVTFAQKSIPFESQSTDSPDVELGQNKILQPGVNGLSVSRIRIRYEDGQEVSRQTESEAIVRAPQDRIEARGTNIVLNTATISGYTFQYWRQLQMYATVYSPCNSGSGGCSSGTASGLRAGKGVVAVDPALYAYLNGQRLYIPGYGPAVIGDIGGGYIVEQNAGVSRYRWIDLGFDDNNIADMTGWVTVYFLAPAPATIPDVLK